MSALERETMTPTARDEQVALKEHLTCIMAEQGKQTIAALDALRKETTLADSVLREQWERGHAVLVAQVERNGQRLDTLESYRDTMQGKASQQSVTIAMILAVVGLLFGVIDLVLKLSGG